MLESVKLAEPVSAIQSLERGVLPSDYLPLVKKIERLFGIYLMKEPQRHFVPAEIVHESKVPSGVTIGELRKMHSNEISKKKKFEEVVPDEEYSEDDELTPEEMEKIIFQRD